jgi:hypothetical protein
MITHFSQMNSIVCRAIKLKALACLFEYLRKSLPRFWGKQAVQDSLVENMTDVFQEVCLNRRGNFAKYMCKHVLNQSPQVTRMNCVQIEDMPNFDSFVAKVAAYDFSTLPRLRSRWVIFLHVQFCELYFGQLCTLLMLTYIILGSFRDLGTLDGIIYSQFPKVRD